MDIQRTMDFIVEQHAAAASRLAGHSKLLNDHAKLIGDQATLARNHAAIQAGHEVTMRRVDRRIDAITKLIHEGMKMPAAGQKETKERRAAQKETDRLFKAWMRRSTNGRH